MDSESAWLRVESSDGIATLFLNTVGEPTLTLTHLRMLAETVSRVAADPTLEILVLRPDRDSGFGWESGPLDRATSAVDAALVSHLGQQSLQHLADADIVTVALLVGPCLGPALELVLACDYRLAVTGPDAWVGFPAMPYWGGSVRAPQLTIGDRATAREAQRMGLLNDSFCSRRAKVELRLFLDRLQRHPRKRNRKVQAERLAAERIALGRAIRSRTFECDVPTAPSIREPLPRRLGLVGFNWLAVEAALRGVTVRLHSVDDSEVSTLLAQCVRRGQVTPLEADQAHTRIQHVTLMELVQDVDWIVSDRVLDLRGHPVRILVPFGLLAAQQAKASFHAGVLGFDQLDPHQVRLRRPQATGLQPNCESWLGRMGVRVTYDDSGSIPLPIPHRIAA